MARRMLPSLDALELLVAVAETGSISGAAARFGISQPSASARMRTLERHLDLRLLDRSTSGSRLTTDGLVVTDWARAVLESSVALVEGAAALRSQQDGRPRLRLAASLTVAEHLLPGWLAALRTSAGAGHDSDVLVGMTVTNSNHVIAAVRDGSADLGFVEGPGVPRDLRGAAVGHDRLAIVVAPGHQLARRAVPLRPAALARLPLLLREPGSGTRETLERALAAHGVAPTPLLELGATAPLRAAALSGTGPAALSVLAVADDLAAGRLVELPVSDELPLRRTLRAVWRRDRRPDGAAARLLALARGHRPTT
jgi:molybdate transport repressor ModE-like protein